MGKPLFNTGFPPSISIGGRWKREYVQVGNQSKPMFENPLSSSLSPMFYRMFGHSPMHFLGSIIEEIISNKPSPPPPFVTSSSVIPEVFFLFLFLGGGGGTNMETGFKRGSWEGILQVKKLEMDGGKNPERREGRRGEETRKGFKIEYPRIKGGGWKLEVRLILYVSIILHPPFRGWGEKYQIFRECKHYNHTPPHPPQVPTYLNSSRHATHPPPPHPSLHPSNPNPQTPRTPKH